MSQYICKICGKPFERRGNAIYCEGPHYRPCPVCGKPVKFRRLSEPIKCCSKSCRIALADKTKSSNPSKICAECEATFSPRQANQKYCPGPHTTKCVICGADITYTCSPSEKPKTCSTICQTKLKEQTVEARYGVNNVSKLAEVQDKISQSKIDKIGYFMKKAESRKSPQTTTRICKYCGEVFEASGTAEYCNRTHYKACVVCGKPFEWDHRNPKDCCSIECSNLLRKQTLGQDMRVCKLCGKPFIPKSGMQIYCNSPHYSNCPICGKPVLMRANYDKNRCCSIKCSNELRKQTNLSTYGVPIASQADSVKKKIHYTCTSSDYQTLRVQNSLNKWGFTNPSMHPDLRNRIAMALRSKSAREKFTATSIAHYGVTHPMKSADVVDRYRVTCEEKYGIPYYCMADDCKAAQGHIVSKINAHIGEIFIQRGLSINYEFRVGKYSYDIRLEGTNILIEINPTFTHNVAYNLWDRPIDKYYHRDKTKFAKDNGYRCINIWDWDDVDSVCSLITPKTILYGRNCRVREIDLATASKFETDNHIQGSLRSQQVCLGLYSDGKLVQIMTFGKPRYNKNYEYELLRLCSDSNYGIVGGAERLWSYFIKSYKPTSIISYCDISKFSGDVYYRLNMTLDGITEPNKNWSKGNEVITNNLLMQRGYDQLFGTNFGKGTSNEELMLQNGWLPVYDCGQYRFVWYS